MTSQDVDSHILALQFEIQNIDEKLQSLEKRIRALLQQQNSLQEEKKKLRESIYELQEESKTLLQSNTQWDSNDFELSEKLRCVLKDTFGLDKFRPLQKEVINLTLSGRDCILIMPTGGGKSLCFHLPTLINKGFSLVITPLVSLMEDQMLALDQVGIPGALLNASIPLKITTEVQKDMASDAPKFKILYVTPEKLAKSKRFMGYLEKAYAAGNINRIVIDEVHCASHWGHDFRPDYKILGILKRMFPKVPILGLTATASEKVLADVKKILNLGTDCIVFRASFNRSNLFYEVHRTAANQHDLVEEISRRIKTEFLNKSGIVYCLSRKDCEDVSSLLVKHGIKASCYHSDLESTLKSKIHKAWSSNDIQVVVATIAFGMGIDKPDVRFVIHYAMSKSMENYYQESGRAGRDEKIAKCILFFRFNDVFRQSSMVFTEHTGLTNLYNMLRYCLAESECRRTLIGECFGEHWPEDRCNEMCDSCINKKDQDILKKDLSKDAAVVMEILTNASAHQDKVTANMVIDAWMGKGKPRHRPKQVAKYTRHECECILLLLLINEIVKESYHFTPYSTLTYLIPGPRWLLLQRGQISVAMDALQPKTVISASFVSNCSKNNTRSIVISESETEKKPNCVATKEISRNQTKEKLTASKFEKPSVGESLLIPAKAGKESTKRKTTSSGKSILFVGNDDDMYDVTNDNKCTSSKQKSKVSSVKKRKTVSVEINSDDSDDVS